MEHYDTIIRKIKGEFVTCSSARRYAMNLGFEISDDGRHASLGDERFVLVADSNDEIVYWQREY